MLGFPVKGMRSHMAYRSYELTYQLPVSVLAGTIPADASKNFHFPRPTRALYAFIFSPASARPRTTSRR